MDQTLITALLRQSLSDPQGAVRSLLSLGLPARAGWIALALMAVGSALLSVLSIRLMPPEAQEFWSGAMASPLRMAGLQWVLLFVTVQIIWRVGRARGGRGSLTDALLVTAWLQFILLMVQAAQIALQLVLPGLAPLASMVSVLLFFWLLTNFIAALHGFSSLLGVLGWILLVTFGVSMVLAIVMITFIGPVAAGASGHV